MAVRSWRSGIVPPVMRESQHVLYCGTMTEIGVRLLQRLEEVLPGISQNELARRVDMDPSALSRVVNGKRALASRELIALAQQLRVSTDWILLGEDPFPVQVAARHDYLGNGSYVRDTSESVAETVRGIARAYEQAHSIASWPNQQPVPTDPEKTRAALEAGYGLNWQRHFADAVEQTFGIDVIKVDLPGSSGLSLKLPNAIVIVVPTEAFWARQNWTIAHELEHIAAGQFTRDGDLSRAEENAANKYAADLLLPVPSIRNIDWKSASEEDLARFLWDAGVSIEALNVRMTYLRTEAPRTSLSTARLARKHISGGSALHDPVAERMREAAARRFPVRLLAAHETNPRTTRTLEWMLGAPFESGVDGTEDDDLMLEAPTLDALADAFGLKVQ